MKVIAFFYPYFSSITETFSTTISQLVLIRQSYSLRCPTLFHKKLATQLPAGSITGAPKDKTMQIIHEAEGYGRGFYTGINGLLLPIPCLPAPSVPFS